MPTRFHVASRVDARQFIYFALKLQIAPSDWSTHLSNYLYRHFFAKKLSTASPFVSSRLLVLSCLVLASVLVIVIPLAFRQKELNYNHILQLLAPSSLSSSSSSSSCLMKKKRRKLTNHQTKRSKTNLEILHSHRRPSLLMSASFDKLTSPRLASPLTSPHLSLDR